MKKLLSLLMTVLLASLAAQAANYGINVGGVEVTTDNYNNVTGGDIQSGTVSYNSSTKVLTLTNVSITRTTSNDYAVHNRSVAGLTIKFVGTCNLMTARSHTIHLDKSTTIEVTSGSTLNVDMYNAYDSEVPAIYINNVAVTIKGPGTLNAWARSGPSESPSAIKGTGPNSSSTVTFSNITATINGDLGSIEDCYSATFNSGSDVHLPAGRSFWDVRYIYCNGNEEFLYPVDTFIKYVHEDYLGNIYELYYYDNNGEEQEATGNVYISDNYGVVFNRSYFPDDAFRIYLKSLHHRAYLTKSEHQNLTSLNVNNKGIYNMTGVAKLTYLQELRCYSNHISSLDLSSNTRLTYLSCYSNSMTSLNVNNCTQLTYLDCAPNSLTSLNVSNLSQLQTLYCYNNQLTSLSLPSSSNSALQEIACQNNAFTSLSITNYPNLTYLNAKDNTSMTSFYCYGNKLSTLNVTGCSALKNLVCYGSNNTFSTLDLTGTTALTYLDCGPCPNLSSITNLSNCTAMQTLICYTTQLSVLSAIWNMSDLESLDCHNTKIVSLDVSDMSKIKTLNCYNNPELDELYCYNTPLTTLNCRYCTSLGSIDCHNTSLSTFDVTGNTLLRYLNCYANSSLTSITGLSSCTGMYQLNCYNTSLTDLSAVSNMTKLDMLKCYNTKLTSLSLTNKTELTTLNCTSIPTMTSLTVTGTPLTSISVLGNTGLTSLTCSSNSSLFSISNLSACTNLTYFNCQNCNLSSLDVTALTKLQTFYCNNNKLTSLNVSSKTNLTYLTCRDNLLTSLNVQGCSKLETLYCYRNKLTSLYLQGCSALKILDCSQNMITGSGMTTLVGSLPTRSSSARGTLYAVRNTDEGNTMTPAQITAAKNKYWTPYRYNGSSWVEMSTVQPGDVDGNGSVNISDVTALIDLLLGGGTISNPAADCNQDSSVNISDVTDLVDYLLSGTWN